MKTSPKRRSRCFFSLALVFTFTVVAGVAQAVPAPQEGKSHVGSITTAGTECITFLIDQAPEGMLVLGGRQVLAATFASGDAIFIDIAGASAPEIGDQLEAVRATSRLNHAGSGADLGIVFERLAVVTVIDVAGSRAMARIEKACREVEVGDSLRPFVPPAERAAIPELPPFDQYRLIEPDEGDAVVVLGEVESVAPFQKGSSRTRGLNRAAYSHNDLVTIDQGAGSGWEYGDIGLIYSGTIAETYGVKMEVPPLIIGRGVITHTAQDQALLKIIDGDGVVELGAAVRNVGSAMTGGGRPGGTSGMAGNSPPTMSCRVERSSVRQGESVRVTAVVSDPDGDATSVTWTASAGRLDPPEGDSSTWSSAGVPNGSVTIRGISADGSGGEAACALVVNIMDQPTSAGPTTLDFDCHEFASGSAEIDNRCKAVLDEVALRLRQNPQATADLTGFSDSTGSADRIQSLSVERAANARTYLVDTHGIDANRVTSRGLGAGDPVAGDDTPEGRARNRRVHLVLTIPSRP